MKKRLFFLATFLLTLLYGVTFAQERTVSGTVTGESGDTLPGATVQIKGTTTGVVTDLDGKYKIELPADATTLVVSFVGMDNKEVTIGNQSVIDIVMSDALELTEVVVVGYGEQSERLSIQNVETVDNAAFKDAPVISVQDALQGQAAGVQMVNSSGIIGAAPNIRIRGVSSINAGGSPLYVVDGVPLNDGAGGQFDYTGGQGGVALNPLADLNNNDIESITVLKDASATAIYGSRGANGVVLIKTKQGKFGEKTTFSFDAFTGVSEPTVLRNMMNADEYRQFGADLYGLDPSTLPQGNFDWPDAVIQTGKISSYTLGARGGSEKTTFYVGGTYLNQTAYTIGNELEKLNGRFNFTHQATDKLKIGLNLALSRSENDRVGADNNTSAPLTSAYLQIPWVQPRDDNGAYVNTGFIQNVIALEELDVNKVITRRSTGNMFLEFDVMEDLTIKTDIGMDNLQFAYQRRQAEINQPGGYASRGYAQDNKWLSTTTANYSKDIGDDHYFGALLGVSYETATRKDIDIDGTGFVADALPNLTSAANPTTTSSAQEEWALFSLFSRFNYRFKNKYLFEASIRRDGSSRFGTNVKYGTFGAASVGWIMSDEAFMDNVSFIDYLKLSASYGTGGNSRIQNYASKGLYTSGQDYNTNPGIAPFRGANSELTWEQTAQLDLTLNATLFNNKLDIEASFYQKTTTDMLFELPVNYTTGLSILRQNTGEMQNTGIDLNITSTNLDMEGFKWTTNLNIGFLNNEVTQLPQDNIDPDGNAYITGSNSQRAIQGNTANTFFLIRYAGINSETGDAEWLTRDGELTTTPTANDRVVVGSAIPDFTGGITNTFTYKGIELSALFTFVQGNKLMLDDRRFSDAPAFWGSFNMTTRMLDYWKNPGDDAFAPALTSSTLGSFRQRSDLQLEDGSYVRLKKLSLAYSLPKSVLDKTKFLSRARIYVYANNLITFTDLEDIDPETSDSGTNQQIQGESFFTAPQAKTITVGVSLGF
jgi:TonB-linked SusC/RagA family outer membrane protein